MKNLFLRELAANRKSFVMWTFTLVLANMFMMLFYPNVADQAEEYNKIIAQFSPEMREALNLNLNFGEILDYFAYVFQYILLFGSIYALIFSANIIAKEEGEKTVDFLLAKPVSRKEIVSAKALTVFIYLVLFNIIFVVANFLSFEMVKRGDYDYKLFFLLPLGHFLIQLMFGAIGLIISAAVNRAKLATPIALGVGFGTYFLSIAAAVSDKLANLKYLTPYKYVNPSDLIKNGYIEPVYLAIIFGVTILCISGTYIIYERKNIVN